MTERLPFCKETNFKIYVSRDDTLKMTFTPPCYFDFRVPILIVKVLDEVTCIIEMCTDFIRQSSMCPLLF